LPLSGVEDIAPLLAALESSGGFLLPEEFRPVLAAARAADAVRRTLAKAETPHLSARRDALPGFETLLSHASRIFAADGTLKDDASPELARLRARLRRRKTEISKNLEKLLDARRDALGDALVVLRNDRYCLPVLASARARVPGIVHDRSGSGHTVFVEPLETIEANNELAMTFGEERREAERILRRFGGEVLEASGALLDAVRQLAELDALEARISFGELTQGRVPELSEDGTWRLAGARHPLLDARLAALRRAVLGETRPPKEAVPLDLELSRDKRLLVVSGPNAGGKTVVLKTAGLFSLLAQSGFPVPAAAGTQLPVFASIRSEIGDAQAILSDRSTFSSSMETLAAILAEAGEGSLALVDEIGAATDPEEGSALAVAFLEEFLARGGRAIVTTHLSALKTFAGERADAVSAAMEFDEATGRPNYRLHPGLSGRSRALAVASERGIPASVLSRAAEILGEAWKRREAAETEAESALERLRRSEQELAKELAEGRRLREEADAEREGLERERKRLLAEGLAGFERARRELARRVESQLEAIRQEPRRRAAASAAEILGEAERALAPEVVLEEAREAALARAAELAVGDLARVRGGTASGTLTSWDGGFAWLEVAGKRLRVPRGELEPVEGTRKKSRERGLSLPLTPAPLPEGEGRGSSEISPITREINVIGQRLDDAIGEVEKAVDAALHEGAGRLRVVHGHGTGRLRNGLREHLRGHRAVARVRAADAREGGNGATIVELIE
jgi:DNA mismatch repair protein MutS2